MIRRLFTCCVVLTVTLPAMAGSSAATVIRGMNPDAHLLLSEVSIRPDGSEFVEIFNPTEHDIDLSDVYLTDATFAGGGVYYYQVVTGGGGGGDFSDFHARFPSGAMIAAGAYQTVALNGSDAFSAAFGIDPDYELYEDAAVADTIADMREAVPGSINGQGALSQGQNNGEVLVLYSWDGVSDLVQDLDYVVWGDKVEAVDKTSVAIDGPDPDSNTSAYLPDTAINFQSVLDVNEHATGSSWQRVDLQEGNEVQSGGNGVFGADETSENLGATWGEGLSTPGAAPGPDLQPGPAVIRINEVDALSSSEDFIELYDGGKGQADLSTYVVVVYDPDETVRFSQSLDGAMTDGSGYYLLGESGVSPDQLLAEELPNEVAAVALYTGTAGNFPPGTALTTVDLVDALVYDTGQADDPGLLTLLEAGELQINEAANGQAASESMQRCPNGSGGLRRTGTYQTVASSPGVANADCSQGDYYAAVDASNATTLRMTLHPVIDDHLWFPYSSSSTDTWDILELADEDPQDPSHILDVYRNASYPKAGGGNPNYNREHTWPRSLGLGDTGTFQNSAATDAHHLRLSDSQYNSDRGNKPFADCDPGLDARCVERATVANGGVGGGSGVYPGQSNWVTAGTDGNAGSFETWTDRRGDVARSIFYMDIRYEGGTHGGTGMSEPQLELTDTRSEIVSTTGPVAYMGLLSVLLNWHEDDPVDAKEQLRNEIVFSFQGNRNPFVDHPEWVGCLYQGVCNGDPDLLFANGFDPVPARNKALH